MFSYEMVGRKPAVYKVEKGGEFATVKKTGDTTRSKRWELFLANESLFFRSRREAFHFFKTGEKFVTKPVYQVLGGRKGNKRIR